MLVPDGIASTESYFLDHLDLIRLGHKLFFNLHLQTSRQLPGIQKILGPLA